MGGPGSGPRKGGGGKGKKANLSAFKNYRKALGGDRGGGVRRKQNKAKH